MWYSDKEWWKMALDRAIRSLAQGVLVGVGENVCVTAWVDMQAKDIPDMAIWLNSFVK